MSFNFDDLGFVSEDEPVQQQQPDVQQFDFGSLGFQSEEQKPKKEKGKLRKVTEQIGEKFSQLPQQLTQAFQDPGQFAEDFKRDIFGVGLEEGQQTPFEEGLNVALREVGAPFAGIPGDIQQLGQQLPFTPGLPFAGKIQEITESQLGIKIPDLPTTENLQQSFDELTDGKYKELPEGVELVAEVGKDLALLMTPLGPLEGFTFLKALGTSLFTNLAAQGMVDSGMIDDGNKDFAKLGIMFATSLPKPTSTRKAAKGFLNKAEKAIKDTVITDGQAVNDLKFAANNIARAGGAEVNPRALNFTRELIKDVESGTFQGDFITRAVRNLNKLLRKVGTSSSEGQALQESRQGLQKIAERAGTTNQNFIKNWNEGNTLFQAANTRNAISEFISQKVPIKELKGANVQLLSLMGLGLLKGKIATIGIPANIAMNALTRVARFPSVQRLYLRFMNEVLKNNSRAAIKSFEQLNKAFNKIEKDEQDSQS